MNSPEVWLKDCGEDLTFSTEYLLKVSLILFLYEVRVHRIRLFVRGGTPVSLADSKAFII